MILGMLAIVFVLVPLLAPRYGVDSRPTGDWRRLTD